MAKEPYSFGHLNDRQAAVVKRFVAGKEVHDLGAGELVLSRKLVDLGARSVFAIDPTIQEPGRLPYPYENIYAAKTGFKTMGRMERIERRGARAGLLNYGVRPVRVAFLSWPSPEDSKFRAHSDYSILALVRRAPIVIYLGKNTDGTMCGSTRLYAHFARRTVLAHEPDRKNTLIVYDGLLPAGKERELLPEEVAGLDPKRIYSYAEAYGPHVTASFLMKRSAS